MFAVGESCLCLDAEDILPFETYRHNFGMTKQNIHHRLGEVE